MVAEMRRVVDEFEDRVLIGEIYLPVDRLVAYYGRDLTGAHLPFNFALLSAPWHARDIAKLIDDYERALPAGAWPNWVLGNHDRPRVASRVGPAQARVAAMLLLTLRGTPTMYYGDEIGMHQVAIAPDQVRDPFEKNVPGLGVGRDGCRTPMQWDAGANGGFTTGTPWLPLAEDAAQENVENLAADSQFDPRALSRADRFAQDHAAACGRQLCRCGDDRRSVGLPAGICRRCASDRSQSRRDPISIASDAVAFAGEILLSTNLDRTGETVSEGLDLRGDEGLIIRLR